MYTVFFLVILYAILCCAIKDLEQSTVIFDKISNYFESGTVKKFEEAWAIQQIPIQIAIEQALRRDYAAVNMMHRDPLPEMTLSKGFFVDDNVVKVAFGDLVLRELPTLRMTNVVVDLPSNVIKVEADLGTIYIDTSYRLLRNESDIVYVNNQQGGVYQHSPFSYQQVQNIGELTIIAENCQISGNVVTKLGTESVNLGADTFWVKQCSYSVEISSRGSGSPPVIAPYFPTNYALLLNSLLTAPLRNELNTKLQSAVYSYINIDAIFGSNVNSSLVRQKQHRIFKETSEYIERWVTTVNVKGSILLNYELGVTQLTNRTVSLLEGDYRDEREQTRLQLKNIVVNGLDNAHSAHIGGPIRDAGFPQITEVIRYDRLQIQGTFKVTSQGVDEKIAFGGELIDVTAAITSVPSNRRTGSIGVKDFNWRKIELSLKNVGKRVHLRFFIQSMIVGFLLENLAKQRSLLFEADLNRDKLDKDYATKLSNGLSIRKISEQLLSNISMNSNSDSRENQKNDEITNPDDNDENDHDNNQNVIDNDQTNYDNQGGDVNEYIKDAVGDDQAGNNDNDKVDGDNKDNNYNSNDSQDIDGNYQAGNIVKRLDVVTSFDGGNRASDINDNMDGGDVDESVDVDDQAGNQDDNTNEGGDFQD